MLNYRWINNRKTFGRKRSQTYLCRPEKWMPKGLFRGNGSVVQLVRMPPCHGGGRGFESRPVRRRGYSNVASFCLCPIMFTSCKVKRIIPFTKDFQKTLISGYWNTIPDCLPILKQKFPGNWFISKNALINQQLCQGKGI